ncbi:MAG: Xaa-Pro peptidase family protein [Candidatus Poribacteria bacterium]|nr:Xaa-Pro peptidase family protein [Candidatus Poribacteria bacterium]
MLTQEGSRIRQEHIREYLSENQIDALLISDYRDIHYLTGLLLDKNFPALLLLETEGGSWLAATTDEGEARVDDRLVYEWQQLYTMNPDPMRCLQRVVEARLKNAPSVKRIGWQAESLPRLLAETAANALHPDAWVAIDDALAGMQMRKDPDEVDLLRGAIQASLAAYTAVQKVIAPGINELTVLAAGQKAAIEAAGEPIEHGGDYCVGELGGPARNHIIEKGQMYIIDAQSEYRGYWSDLCRTFVVGGEPTGLQQSVYDHIAAILADVPTLVKPGGRGTELWRIIDERLREHPHLADTGLIHHAGHGVGSRPHEMPDLNRDREGIFEVGNVFSCEPGAYSDELRGGVRLENTFLITESGIENLSEYPTNLIPAA